MPRHPPRIAHAQARARVVEHVLEVRDARVVVVLAGEERAREGGGVDVGEGVRGGVPAAVASAGRHECGGEREKRGRESAAKPKRRRGEGERATEARQGEKERGEKRGTGIENRGKETSGRRTPGRGRVRGGRGRGRGRHEAEVEQGDGTE